MIRRFLGLRLAAPAALLVAAPAGAIECETLPTDAGLFTVCRADVDHDELHLFLAGADGRPLRTFEALEALVEGRGGRLAFAMNAGMFHDDRRPVGLFVEGGEEIAPLNLDDGFGNFFLKPNGVFLVGPRGAAIVESTELSEARPAMTLATQSGPLLVAHGELHPRLDPESTSRFIRNGVGVDEEGAVIFAISHEPVSFHAFAAVFRDTLDCPDVLYLDGTVSSIFAPALGQHVRRAELGPIIAVVAPQEPGVQ